MLRLLVFVLLAYIIVSAIRAHFAGKNRSARRRGAANDGEEMVLDPQCKSYVAKGEAIEQGGNYFCSPECAKLFLSR